MPQRFDIFIKTIGGSDIGYMLNRDQNGHRGWGVKDAQTIVGRFLTQEQLTQAQLPPDLELVQFQDNWRKGIGGLRDRKHKDFLANSTKIDITEEGVIKLARNLVATTVDSAPDLRNATGFMVSGTQLWSFIGRDVYSWDFTNKNWDIQTEPVAAARIYRRGIHLGDNLFAPAWADDVGSGGSFTAADEPIEYIFKASGDAQWTVITTGSTLAGCKYMAFADGKLWGGYWSSHADAAVDIETDFIALVGVSGSTVSSLTTGSITPSPSAGSRLMLITVHLETSGGTTAVSSVAFGAQSATRLRRASAGDVAVEVWYVKNPTASSATIVATLGATEDSGRVTAHVYADVDPDYPTTNGNVASGSSTSPLVAVTSGADDRVFNAVTIESLSNATVASPATRREHAAGGSQRAATSDEEATGTSTSTVWTAGNAQWVIIGTSIPAGIRSDATVIKTDATPASNLSEGDVIRYGTDAETMLVTTVSDGDPSLTVTRAYRGSVVANHAGNTINTVTENRHHVRSAADPTDLVNFSTATIVGNASAPITALVGVDTDLVVIKEDGIYTLEADGTVFNRLPEIVALAHQEFGKGSFGWNSIVFIPLHGGGLWELETITWTIRDISFSHSMPLLTEYHGKIVAGHGEPGRLYVMVDEPRSTQYHILMTENPNQTGLGDYNWTHVATIGYTTGTDNAHAALLLEAMTSGSAEHHRLWIGHEDTGGADANKLPHFITHDSHDDDDDFTDDSDAYAYTTIFDAGFPNVDKRFKDITFTTDNLDGNIDTGIDTAEALDDSETVIDVDADPTTAITANALITIDNETMLVLASQTGPNNITVRRGYAGTTAATHSTNADIFQDHYIAVQYRVNNGSWTDLTGTASTSVLTADSQTLTFAAGVSGKIIELRFLLRRTSVDDGTSPELHDFTATGQLRTDAIKTIPLRLYLANGQRLLNGMFDYKVVPTKRNQLRTWNTQSDEVVLTGTEGETRNCIFLPGMMRESEIIRGYHSQPEYIVDVLLGEVG
jgi:hypothetical protein